jgi:hypothetical protein
MARSPKRRDALPPWTGDDSGMRAWVFAELDKLDAAADREMANTAAAIVRAYAHEARDDSERRKRKLIIGKRDRAKIRAAEEQAAIEHGDVEALRTLHPKHAHFINPPARDPGRPKKVPDPNDYLSPKHRLEEALFDRKRISALWKKYYGRRNRPQGTVTAAEIAAERWGLSVYEVEKLYVRR